MRILILGAAGQLAEKVRETLFQHTHATLVLYARDASERLHPKLVINLRLDISSVGEDC